MASAATGFYRSCISSGPSPSNNNTDDFNSSFVDDFYKDNEDRGGLERFKALTLPNLARFDEDESPVATPHLRVATSDEVCNASIDNHPLMSKTQHNFEPSQLLWEISAHTEKTSDQMSSRRFPELVLTDSSFLSTTTMIQDDVIENQYDKNRNRVGGSTSFEKPTYTELFELLTDENEPISFQSSVSTSHHHHHRCVHEDSIFSPRPHLHPRSRSSSPSLQPHDEEEISLNCSSKLAPSSRRSRLINDQYPSFDQYQMLRKVNIQVQLELNKIEASRQQMQSIEDNNNRVPVTSAVSSKEEGVTPRCSLKDAVTNTMSKISRLFYHCCHRQQSKKEKELLKKIRENCNRIHPNSVHSPSGSASSSYHQRRHALMKKKIEGMINSSAEHVQQLKKRPVDKDSLRLDLRKVHESAPVTNRLSLSSKYRKYKSGSKLSRNSNQITHHTYSVKTKEGGSCKNRRSG
eukprot:g3153.t1